MKYLFKNKAVTYVPGATANNASSIVLTAGEGDKFPSPVGYPAERAMLVFEDRLTGLFEIAHLTSRSGNTLYLVRGQDGTIARDWPAGTQLSLRATAESHEAMNTYQDHGNLGGLGDDDHSQYHNNTRGDIRYVVKTASTPDTIAGQITMTVNNDTSLRIRKANTGLIAGFGIDEAPNPGYPSLRLRYTPQDGAEYTVGRFEGDDVLLENYGDRSFLRKGNGDMLYLLAAGETTGENLTITDQFFLSRGGTAANPALKVLDDTTGLYHGNGNLRITYGGVSNYAFNGTGELGVDNDVVTRSRGDARYVGSKGVPGATFAGGKVNANGTFNSSFGLKAAIGRDLGMNQYSYEFLDNATPGNSQYHVSVQPYGNSAAGGAENRYFGYVTQLLASGFTIRIMDSAASTSSDQNHTILVTKTET